MHRRSQQALRHEKTRIDVSPEETLRLAVVADTHGRPHPATIEHLRLLRPDVILHGGDIGDLAVLDELAQVAHVHAVRGNIDDRASGIPDAITITVGEGSFVRTTMLLLHIAVNGPKLRADAVRLAKREGAGLVVCGHSHVPFIGRDQGLVMFNPGSVGPRRFTLPIVFGVIEVGPAAMSLRHVDCETGETWMPP